MPHLIRALPLLLAFTLFGCTDDDGGGGKGGPVGCTTDETCPIDTRCFDGVCAGGLAPDWPLRLRILPPVGSNLAPVEIEGQLFLGASAVRLDDPIVLPKRIPVSVQVRTIDGVAVAGKLVARPPTRLSTQSLGASVDSQFVDGEPLFNLELAASWPTLDGGRQTVPYGLLLQDASVPDPSCDRAAGPCPGDTPLPPWRFDSAPFSTANPEFMGQLPDDSALVRVSGTVLLSEASLLPGQNLSVAAFGLGGERVSTEATTDELGRFDIALWPTAEPREVTVRVTSTVADRQLPSLAYRITVGPEAVVDARWSFGDHGVLSTVRGLIGTAEDPIGGALVRLDADVGNGRFSTTARTEADGSFSTRVYPGVYRVHVEPPPGPGSPYRLTRRQETVTDGADPIVVVPGLRTQVSGQVTDPGGYPLASATVTAVLVTPRYADAALSRPDDIVPNRQFATETDAEGKFSLYLDRGEHRISIVPESTSGLPAHQALVSVASSDPVAIDTASLAVPPAVALTLTLVDENGAPVSGALVEGWRDGTTPARVAERTTGLDGKVTLPLPNVP